MGIVEAKTVDSASIAMKKINNKLTSETVLYDNSCQEVDIIFILDRSQSIDPYVYNNVVKPFVLNISNRFTFEDEAHGRPNFARIGVIQFTDTVDITIPLQNTLDRNTFNQEVMNDVVYGQGGDTNLSVGLNAAYQEFVNNPRTPYRVAILMTDGVDSFESDINDIATIIAARKLETIVPVFMGIGIGDEGSMNMENLTALLGNKTQYAYDNITDAYNVRFGVAPEIAMAYPCPAIGCKGVLFVEEMTEIVGLENKMIFLEATLGISKILHSIDNNTQFGLVLFNNVTISYNPTDYDSFVTIVKRKRPEWCCLTMVLFNNVTISYNPTDYDSFVTIVNNYLSTERQNNTPEAGLTYTAGKIDDGYSLAKSLASQLASITDFYVVDTTVHNFTQEDVLYTLINNNFDRYINDTNYAAKSIYQIVDAFNKSLVLDIKNYPCTIPGCTCPSNAWFQSTVDPCNCLRFSNNPKDWNSANNDCKQQNFQAALASIDSVFENNALLASGESQANCSQFFIGLNMQTTNQWTWINNDSSLYRNWRPGYPTSNNNLKCSQLNANDGKWTNIDCSSIGCYICEIKMH